MITGAREARTASWFHRLAARATGRELTAFVVPGPEVARARAVDVEAAGLRVVSNPRHANVLVVVGELPRGLREAAAVAYAQMMRPRAVLAAGAGEVAPLPGPDVPVDLRQDAVAGGVAGLRRAFAEGAFAPETSSFEAGVVQDEEEEESGEEQDGDQESMDPGDGDEQGSGGHEGAEAGNGSDHARMRHGSGTEQEGSQEEDQGSGEDEEMDPGDGEGMDHGDMDFMSMVEMTKDMPASGDGLKMEWVEAPYGPLFPGLPGGLALTFTLDGDTVAQAEAGIEDRAPVEDRTGEAEGFADRLARLDPLSPVAYRLLALRALEDAAGASPDERAVLARVGALELERAASHLGWLANLGYLIGGRWLSRRAGELQLALLRAPDAGEVERLRTDVGRFIGRVGRTPLLKKRLEGIGSLSPTEAAGPVARAGGVDADARADEPAYRDLGFAPVVREGNDALARLRVRLEEVERSLDLVVAAGSVGAPDRPASVPDSGTGRAAVETPRGAATLSVTLQGGAVSAVELDAPSARNLALIGAVTEGKEVGDALVGVASLDLSPWEVTR